MDGLPGMAVARKRVRLSWHGALAVSKNSVAELMNGANAWRSNMTRVRVKISSAKPRIVAGQATVFH